MQRRADSIPLRGTRCETCSRTPERSRRAQRLLDRLVGTLVAPPRVRRVEAVPPAAHLAHRDELVLVGAALGRVLEPGRVAPGALLERLVEQVAHLVSSSGRAGRSASPTTDSRIWPFGTRLTTLIAGAASSSRSKYPAADVQVSGTSAEWP